MLNKNDKDIVVQVYEYCKNGTDETPDIPGDHPKGNTLYNVMILASKDKEAGLKYFKRLLPEEYIELSGHTPPPSLDFMDIKLLRPIDIKNAFDRTDAGDADLFALLYKDNFIFDHSEEYWYRWNGQHWELDKTQFVRGFIRTKVRAQYEYILDIIMDEQPDDKEEKKLQGDLIKAYQKRIRELTGIVKVKRVLEMAQSIQDMAITGDRWDNAPGKLACPNGVIDLATGTLENGRPTDYIRSNCPTEYHGLDLSCPMFDKLCLEIFGGDKKLVAYFLKSIGYAIAGDPKEHIFFVWYGAGRNGKGTLIQILKEVLGDFFHAGSKDLLIQPDRLSSPGNASEHLADLQGKRLVVVSEIEKNAKLAMAQVKMLTGGDTITARRLYGHQFSFRPEFSLVLLTNEKPEADADDYALWKRVRLIAFNESFVDEPKLPHEHKAIPGIEKEILANEREAILSCIVRGYIDYLENGLQTPDKVRVATEAYRSEQDILTDFLVENCVFGDKKKYMVGKQELYNAYSRFNSSMTNMAFYKEMSKRIKDGRLDIEEKRISRGVFYFGIGLLTSDDSM